VPLSGIASELLAASLRAKSPNADGFLKSQRQKTSRITPLFTALKPEFRNWNT